MYYKKTIKKILNSVISYYLPHASSSNKVLFTFDDGPNANITPQVLNILDTYNVKACFFVVGKFAIDKPALLFEIKKRGHIIGNHSYSHPRNKPNISKYLTELQDCQKTIQAILSISPKLFRPIRGEITIGSVWAAKKLRLRLMLWSIEGEEWGNAKERSAEWIGYRLANEVKAGDIILLHDNHQKTPAILNTLLPILIKKGFDLSTAVNYY